MNIRQPPVAIIFVTMTGFEPFSITFLSKMTLKLIPISYKKCVVLIQNDVNFIFFHFLLFFEFLKRNLSCTLFQVHIIVTVPEWHMFCMNEQHTHIWENIFYSVCVSNELQLQNHNTQIYIISRSIEYNWDYTLQVVVVHTYE